MNQPKLHKILPNLIFSAAAIVPGATAALIMLHASDSTTVDLASASAAGLASSDPVSTPVATTRERTTGGTKHRARLGQKRQSVTAHAAATPTRTVKKSTVSSVARRALKAAATPTPLPTVAATSSGQATGLQSAPLQAQNTNTNAVSGATGR